MPKSAEHKEYRAERTILEIGSGNRPAFVKFENDSWLTQEIRNSRYICLDVDPLLSPKLKTDSAYKTEADKLELDVELVLADGRKLPFADESIDEIIISDVLSFRIIPADEISPSDRWPYAYSKVNLAKELANRKSLIEEIYRVLKTEGKLIVSDFYNLLDQQAYQKSVEFLKRDPRFNFEELEISHEGKIGKVLVFKK